MSVQNVSFIRVRYSETDAFGTYYNSRALEWFECARTELCRSTGKPYTAWEAEGVAVPLAEAHVEYLGRACYDDLLKVTAVGRMEGKVRLRFDLSVENAETGAPVCRGYTLHAITNMSGRPIRPPEWLRDLMAGEEVLAADGEDDQ